MHIHPISLSFISFLSLISSLHAILLFRNNRACAGELTSVQPKAAGSSLIAVLANAMMCDVLKVLHTHPNYYPILTPSQVSGIPRATACMIVPVATGMAVVLTLLTIRMARPKARFVIWPRIDQKSCLKAIFAAGFEPLVVANVLEGDEVEIMIYFSH